MKHTTEMGLREVRGASCGKINVTFNKLAMLPDVHSVATHSWDGHSDSAPSPVSDGRIYLFISSFSLSASALKEFIIPITETSENLN